MTRKRRLCDILTAFIAVAAVAGIIDRTLIRLLFGIIHTTVGCHHLTGAGTLRCSWCNIMGNRVKRHQKYRNNN